MGPVRWWWIAAGALCAAGARAGADEPPPSVLERLSLEDLMHVRVRSASLTSQAVRTAPSLISVITADQIRALGLRTLADVLQLFPGVTVLPTQFGGQRVLIRGDDDVNDVLVTLDGERLNDFYDGSFPTQLPLENVDRVELIRGPGSALYGTNAAAGVISIYSKSDLEVYGGLGAEASFDHSAGLGMRGHAKLARRLGQRYTLQLFGSYWESTGPKVLVTRDNADPRYSLVPAETNAPIRVALAQLVLTRRALLVRNDSLELWAAFLYQRRGPYFGPDNVLALGSDLERSSQYVRLAYQAPLGGGVVVSHSVGFDRRDAESRIQDEPPGYFHEADGNFTREPGEVFPDGRRNAFTFATYHLAEHGQVEWRLAQPRGIVGNDLIVGGTLDYSWLPSFTYGQNWCCGTALLYAGPTLQNWDALPLTQLHKDRLIAAGFVHDQLQPVSWLWITLGFRLDWYSDFGLTWNPRAAVVIRAHPKLSFKLLYGRAFRAPSFRELYDQAGVSQTAGGLPIEGNPKLRPETSNTAEAGVETSPWQHLTLRADGFYVRTADSVDVDATFTVSGARIINFPGVQELGAEAEAQLHLDPGNYLLANLSFVDSTLLGSGLAGWQTDAERRFIDTRLEALPRLRLNVITVATPLSRLRVPSTLAQLTLGIGYHYVSALANNNRFTFEALSIFRQPPFHELSINVAQPLRHGHIEINATLQLSFGRAIAVPLTNGWYDLPTNAANLFVGVRVHD